MPEVHSHLLAFIVHNPSFDAYSWPREAPTVWTNLKIVMLPAGTMNPLRTVRIPRLPGSRSRRIFKTVSDALPPDLGNACPYTGSMNQALILPPKKLNSLQHARVGMRSALIAIVGDT
jgi:hypothetical protein